MSECAREVLDKSVKAVWICVIFPLFCLIFVILILVLGLRKTLLPVQGWLVDVP